LKGFNFGLVYFSEKFAKKIAIVIVKSKIKRNKYDLIIMTVTVADGKPRDELIDPSFKLVTVA
jgi:hypothetical protein